MRGSLRTTPRQAEKCRATWLCRGAGCKKSLRKKRELSVLRQEGGEMLFCDWSERPSQQASTAQLLAVFCLYPVPAKLWQMRRSKQPTISSTKIPLADERQVKSASAARKATSARSQRKADRTRKSRNFQYEVSAPGYVPARDVAWQSFSRSI